MYSSLFWIEWLDRLNRVLNSAGEDVSALTRIVSPRGLASVQRSARQLSALSNDLRLLDRKVFGDAATPDAAAGLQKALDTVLFRLNNLSELQAATAPAIRDRLLGGIDAALRDSRFEAAVLLEPKLRRA